MRACNYLLSKGLRAEPLLAAYPRPAPSDIDVAKLVHLPALSSIKVFVIDEKEAAVKRADSLKRWQGLAAAAGN